MPKVNMGTNIFFQYAFISYSHRDSNVAHRLHRKLEQYRLPAGVHNEYMDSKYLRPVFRDQDDLNSGVLGDEIRKQLEGSKYLVVICSPFSAQSEWVSREVQYFIDLGRANCIIPYNIGKVNKECCFPATLSQYINEHPEKELLGINVCEDGANKAFVKLVSKMLDVSFDVLWKRHLRETRSKVIVSTIFSTLLLAAAYYFTIPVTLVVNISDETHNLPVPDNAKLKIDEFEYPLSNLDTILYVESMPGYFKLKNISLSFSAIYYQQYTQTHKLSLGAKQRISIHVKRDSTFSIFSGHVLDPNNMGVCNAIVSICDNSTNTDSNGYFRIVLPIQEQKITQSIHITCEGMKDIERWDESPSQSLVYIMRVK